MNFHGGGWVFDDLETAHNFCKRVAIELDYVTFDVDYRPAPEYSFPIPVDDSWVALNWGCLPLPFSSHVSCSGVPQANDDQMREKQAEFNLDLNRVAVGGCLAGGRITAIFSHMCRDAGGQIALQLLAVPVTDLHVFTPTSELTEDCPYESYREMADTRPLSCARMSWFHSKFLGNPRVKGLDNVSQSMRYNHCPPVQF